MKKIFKFSVSAISILCLSACAEGENPLAYSKDAHGRGNISIQIEESFKPLFDTSIYTFESQFPKATINPVYSSEGKIIEAFFQNKVKTICISRDFTKEEKAQLKKQQVEVRSDKVAQDAVTLIVNPANNDTLMTMDKLKRILTGKDTVWDGLKTKINVVFDQKNSANFNYLKNLVQKEDLPVNVFAVNSNVEVINYVKKNKSALGVIGLNWVSDQDDFDVLDFVDGIKVISLAKTENGKYFKPYAGFIYTQEYPLYREIWMINKAKKSGLNTGFVLFMLGDKGQLIVQKSALVPATAPVRLIQMTTE
jgi:phosphate transport system substrate-binding protein